MLDKFKLDFIQCFNLACQHGAYNIIKYLTKKKVVPSQENYIDIFKNGILLCCTYIINLYKPPFAGEWYKCVIANDNVQVLKFLHTYYKLKIKGYFVTNYENYTYHVSTDDKNSSHYLCATYVETGSIKCYEFVRNLSYQNILPRTYLKLYNIDDEDKIIRFLQFKEFYISGQYGYIIRKDFSLVLKLLLENETYDPSIILRHIRLRLLRKKQRPFKICKFMSERYPVLYKEYIIHDA